MATIRTWGRFETCLSEASSTKSVATTNGCAYCVNSHTAALQRLGMSTEALGELMAIAGLFNMTNVLADGYQVEPDVLPRVDVDGKQG